MIENGVLLVDKPIGISSFGVVARVRRQLSEHFGHKMKVGHTGTLDPFASGLMILVVGKECKNAAKYTKLDKVYEATMVLGKKSSTGDPEGEIENISNKKIVQSEIETILPQFLGAIEQIPPAYSAIKINGQRAYKLARAGKKPDIPKRQINIYSIDIVEYSYPELKVVTKVSSGTYIRTLAEDIGEALGVGAYCSELRRVSIDEYSVQNAQKVVK